MSNIIKFDANRNPELDEIMEGFINDFVDTAETKTQILQEAYENAKACIEENGMNVEDFALNDDAQRFLGQDLELTMEDGIAFILLDDLPDDADKIEDLEYVYEIVCSVCMTEDGQCKIAAHMSRADVRGIPEMLIDGKWTKFFAFEDEYELKACEKCEHKDNCMRYLTQKEEFEDEDEDERDEDEYLASIEADMIEDPIDPVYEMMTDNQKELDDEGDALTSLLRTLTELNQGITDEEWENAKKEYASLAWLLENSDYLLSATTDQDRNVILKPADFLDTYGFMIRQNDGKVELCQHIDSVMSMMSYYEDFDEWVEDEDSDDYRSDKEYIRVVASVDKPEDLMEFIHEYVKLRQSKTMKYVVPLSLNRIIVLKGILIDVDDKPKKAVVSVLEDEDTTREEKAAARSWLYAFNEIV